MSLFMPPLCSHLVHGLGEMDVGIDVIDPGDRNEVMMAGISILCHLDFIRTLKVIDLPINSPDLS
jgi:hypothetical protein